MRIAVVVLGAVSTLALALAISALLELPAPTRQPNLSRFVTKAQLGIGSAALAQQANAAMKGYVRQYGLIPLKATIVSEKLDGDRGTVVIRETWKAPGHRAVSYDFTLIFHRTVWSLGSLEPGAPAGMSQ